MSLTVGELQVLLSGDPRPLNRALDQIDARAGDTERKHSAAWGRIGAAAGTAMKAGAVVATGAVVALGAAIKHGIDLVGFQQQAQISFATLLGGADKAKAYLADLTAFAARTPFELPGVVQAAQQLLGVGRSAESVIPTLEAWGNASGALGQTQEQFGRTMTAVTQMIGKGKVSAEEMMQITEAGIPIWGLLAQATGKPIAELQKLATEGKLLADDVLPLLEAQMQKNYGGAMAAQAQTLNGVLSTAKDNLNLALADGVKPLAAGLAVLLPPATAKAGEAIRELGQRGSQGLIDLIDSGQKLAVRFGPELSQVADMASTKWGQFTDTVKRIGAEIGPSLPAVADALLRIAQVGVDVGTSMVPVLNAGISALGPISQAAAGALQLIAGALEVMEPVLPIVVTGFLAFKVVAGIMGASAAATGALAARMGVLAAQTQIATVAMTGSFRAGAMAGSAMLGVGRALPVVGLAVVALGLVMQNNKQKTDDYARALLEGGKTAAAAVKEMSNPSLWDKFTFNLSHWGNTEDVAARQTREATEAAKAQYEAMSPLAQAQQDVTTATNDLALAQAKYGRDSGQAFGASITLRDAQANLEQKQKDLDDATKSATQSLLDQANQAIGLANADIGLSNAMLGVQDAQTNYATVMADGAATTADRQRAENDLAAAMINGAGAAGRKAEADNAGKTPAEIHAASTKAQYDALVAFAQQAGGNVPATVQTLMGSLGAATTTGAVTAAAMRDLGASVTEIPDQKFVHVDAPTEEQRKRIEGLGLQVVNLPDGDVYVAANTQDAEAAINYAARARNATIYATVQTLNPSNVAGAIGSALGGADGGIVHRYAQGGFEPMKGGIAQVVGPNTWRVIGDRVRDDEAYIPINRDARSLSILSQTARRMGGQFVPNGVGASGAAGGSTGTGSGTVIAKHYSISTVVREVLTEDQIMRAVRQSEAIYG